MKANVITKLSEREHLLLRPQMYLGSIANEVVEGFMLNTTNKKFEFSKKQYVPALVKIINEVIDNSIDEAVRTNYTFANKIEVTMTNTSIEVHDNGRGIPVTQDASGEWMPVLAWCHARAGSNFAENSETIGTNGVGSFATNVWSTKFLGKTSDGENELVLTSLENASNITVSVKPRSRKGTTVYFEPDLKRFNIQELSAEYKELIHQRIVLLAVTYPQIKFYFNDEKISINANMFYNMFGDVFEVFEEENYSFAVFPNEFDDFKSFSLVNGLAVPNGGSHIDFVTGNIIPEIKDKISKKYKDIKTGDIKNKIMVVGILRKFKDAKWESQTKERLTNSSAQIKEYMGKADLSRFISKIYKNDTIMFPIIETYKIKEEMKERQHLNNLTDKPVKKLKIEKYMPAQKEKKYLFITEGDSACGLISKVIGRDISGFFPLRGKPLNVHEQLASRIKDNAETKNLIDIINNEKYEMCVIATDADLDGVSIRGLLLIFFQKFYPEMLRDKKIGFLKTPLVIARKNNKAKHFFYTFEEYRTFEKNNTGFTYNYLKGLGTNKPTELTEIFENNGGFESFIETFDYDDEAEKMLNTWFAGANADLRKDELNGFSFSIELI